MRATNDATDRVTCAGSVDASNYAGQGGSAGEYDEDKLEIASVSHVARAETEKAGRGLGAGRLLELARQLSERDFAVLDQLRDHRYLTTHQIGRFCFTGHASNASARRTTRRVLARLERDRLVQRPFRSIGGTVAGSTVSVWMLTSSGVRLLNQQAGLGAVGRAYPPGYAMLRHFLAVTDTNIALLDAHDHGLVTVHEVAVEPKCWRTYSTGMTRSTLKPDLFVVTIPKDEPDAEDHWFVEVDRGTEAIPRLIDQCKRYEVYRASGDAGDVFPLVIWIIPTEHRAELLRLAIQRSRLTHELYRVVTPERFEPLVVGGAV